MDSVKKEDGSKMFWSVGEEEMTCFENIVRQRLTERNSDVVLGTHRITYFIQIPLWPCLTIYMIHLYLVFLCCWVLMWKGF